MKRFKNILGFGLLLIVLVSSSCNKFLDLAPGQDLSEDDVFKDYNNFRKYSDYNYQYQRYFAHLGRLWNAMQATMSDEATTSGGSTAAMRQGNWSTIGQTDWPNETDRMWTYMYQGIRRVNMVFKRIDEVPNFPSEAVKKRTLGENYFLRAQFYFELVKRYGGIPLVEKTLSGEENLDLPRASYEDCVKMMVADCDMAANLLDATYAEADNGRATKGAAMALKSRVLLYAASPLNNPSDDIEKWRSAANAAKAVMDLKLYSLYPDLHELFFQPTSSEVILNKPRGKMTFNQGHTDNGAFWVRFIAPEGYQGWNGTSVTQDFVDLYETANGYPIDDPKGLYNANDPYKNRDPRLNIDILVNDVDWLGRKTEFYVGGREIGTANRNMTGYSLRKYWPLNFPRSGTATTYLNYIMFRYAEILLNYAEALNEVEGPTQAVRDAINEVRGRVNQVDVPVDISSTKETMRLRIQNERAVELSFEEQRFYDLLRWKKGPEFLNGPISGMSIVKNKDNTFSYTRFVVENRVFLDYMHRYPLPSAEIYKSKGILKQNDGWPQ